MAREPGREAGAGVREGQREALKVREVRERGGKRGGRERKNRVLERIRTSEIEVERD